MDYQKLFDAIQADYDGWRDYAGLPKEKLNLRVLVGRKYAKICRNEGQEAWGFVQLEDCDKFKKGDLLFAATWDRPARNKARGNLISGDLSQVMWSGLSRLDLATASTWRNGKWT